jgi:hypothetical protein
MASKKQGTSGVEGNLATGVNLIWSSSKLIFQSL